MMFKAYFIVVILFMKTYVTHSQTHCIQDCSTSSLHVEDYSPHFASCSIQAQSCKSNLSDLFPTAPQEKTTGEGWYLYPDLDDTQYEKIALNFSWGPQHDGTVRSLHGYQITMIRSGEIPLSVFFCINDSLDFFKHVFLTYYYDCFGTSSNIQFFPNFLHESFIQVQIRSLPTPLHNLDDQFLSISISIPSCLDPRLENVSKCHQLKDFTLSAGNVSCTNRSVEIFYNVPSLFGNFVNILLFENITAETVHDEEILNQSPTSYIIYVPETFNLNGKFLVRLSGSSFSVLQKSTVVDFSSCVDTFLLPENLLTALIGIPLMIVLAIIIAIIFVRCRMKNADKSVSPSLIHKDLGQTHKIESEESFQSQNIAVKKKMEKLVKVYLIFLDEHAKHKQTVLDFANYLIGDLKFDVVTEFYQRQAIAEDPTTWMEKSFTTSDKILVIWSPGASNAWERYRNGENDEQDLFTPVLNHIYKDLFLNKSVGKYYFGYFEYCTQNDIPKKFREFPAFQIMSQFEKLYYRLKEVEMYMPGARLTSDKITYDHYHDATDTYGSKLYTSIKKMCEFVNNNPDWYLKECGTGSIEELSENFLSRRVSDGDLEINELAISPPEEITENSLDSIFSLQIVQGRLTTPTASVNKNNPSLCMELEQTGNSLSDSQFSGNENLAHPIGEDSGFHSTGSFSNENSDLLHSIDQEPCSVLLPLKVRCCL